MGHLNLYDPWEEGLSTGHWTQRDHSQIHVSKMSDGHILNTIRLCERWKLAATFECDEDKWQGWIDLLADELNGRDIHPAPITSRHLVRGQTRSMRCHCGREYEARKADLDRGWALSCSKRCAAVRREFGRPAAKPIVVVIGL